MYLFSNIFVIGSDDIFELLTRNYFNSTKGVNSRLLLYVVIATARRIIYCAFVELSISQIEPCGIYMGHIQCAGLHM